MLNLIDIIHFTEKVSSKIHGVLEKTEIYRIVVKEFKKSKKYDATVYQLTDDGSKLEIVETALSSRKLKAVEKATGLTRKRYKIDLNKSTFLSQVAREGKTIQVNLSDVIGELFLGPLAFLIVKTSGYEERTSIMTPLKQKGR